MGANGDLSKKFVSVYTVVYLVSDGHVLLIKKPTDAPILAGCFLGVGGHLERGEDPHVCAMRECEEECGLVPRDLRLRGTLVWECAPDVIDKGPGFLYIFTAISWEGTLRPSVEGDLLWVPITTLEQLDRFPEVHRRYIPQLLRDANVFLAGFVHCRDGGVLEYMDSNEYFAQRPLVR